jgi:holo-[acyl-carrier protein] synthase
MIAGIGTDVVHIDRIGKVLERHGQRFVARILTAEERVRFERTRAKASHLAKRFAAKEAFSKAIGTGIRSPFRWHSVTVARDPKGKPILKPDTRMAAHLEQLGITKLHVSLTDDAQIAIAFVVLEMDASRLP